MGTISNARAYFGLLATGTPTKTQVDGSVQIGVGSTVTTLTGATKAYCVSATLATAGDTLTIDTATGIATIGTTPVSQVETATVVAGAGATSSGNLAVTVTAAGVTGSPLVFSVALVNGVDTTAALIAAKIRTAFNNNAALTAVYTVGGTGADVTLTRTVSANDDATLNIAITAGLGVSSIVSSTNTTAGVGGVVLTNNTGDGRDFEGVSLGAVGVIRGMLIKSISGNEFDIAATGFAIDGFPAFGVMQYMCADGLALSGDIEITALGSCEVEITLIQSDFV